MRLIHPIYGAGTVIAASRGVMVRLKLDAPAEFCGKRHAELTVSSRVCAAA